VPMHLIKSYVMLMQNLLRTRHRGCLLYYVVEYEKGAKLHRVSAEASLLPFIRGKVPILLASKVGRITHNHLVEK